MEITEIKIYKARGNGPVLAYANIILEKKFIIRGITLLETEKTGRFLGMPRRRLRNVDRRAYRDICHPLDNEVRKELTDAIFAAYDKFIEETEE